MTTYELSEMDIHSLLAITAKATLQSHHGVKYSTIKREVATSLKKCKLDSDFVHMIVGAALAG